MPILVLRRYGYYLCHTGLTFSFCSNKDLSLRAYLKGWQFVFLDAVTCDCEIPACYDAYRKQQHRWYVGGVFVAERERLLRCFFFQTFLKARALAVFSMTVVGYRV